MNGRDLNSGWNCSRQGCALRLAQNGQATTQACLGGTAAPLVPRHVTYLCRHEEAVALELRDLHARPSLIAPHKPQARRLELGHQLWVDFVPVGAG